MSDVEWPDLNFCTKEEKTQPQSRKGREGTQRKRCESLPGSVKIARNLKFRTPILGSTPGHRYFPTMESSTVEERLTRIKREFDELKHGPQPHQWMTVSACIVRLRAARFSPSWIHR